MANRGKVIKALECCTRGNACFSDCPYFKETSMTDGRCITASQADALALLKEQEAVKPKIDAFGHPYCPKCEVLVYQTWNFCPHCGHEVKWK